MKQQLDGPYSLLRLKNREAIYRKQRSPQNKYYILLKLLPGEKHQDWFAFP
jgi:hypothetical protein